MADDEFDEEDLQFDDDEDEQPAPSTALAAPAQVAVVAAPLASASSSAGDVQLEGNEGTPVWSVYKDVMSSVFTKVRELVEQEGLEPSVAFELRNVRRRRPSPRALVALVALASRRAGSSPCRSGGPGA